MTPHNAATTAMSVVAAAKSGPIHPVSASVAPLNMAITDDQHSGQVRMAYRLAAEYQDKLLHVHGIGWHYWDGSRWAFDDQGCAKRAVLDVLKSAWVESFLTVDKEERKRLISDIRRCETSTALAGVLSIAAALAVFAVTARDLDASPYLLNVSNGTLNLKTMILQPHSANDRISKICRGAYRPEVTAVNWERFLGQVLPDIEVRRFLQQVVGIGLLGAVREHILPILTGTGANGKSVFDKGIRYGLGDYAIAAEPDLFMHRDGAHPTGEMDLRGVRWVSVSESDKDRRLAEATVKRLTGGDTVRARRMRQDFIEFDPSHTAVLITNHLPRVSGDDPAIWRRLRVVPFKVVIPESEQDAALGEKLEGEVDGILSWMVAGLNDYLSTGGLQEPKSVRVATVAYKTTSDAVQRFIDECCVIGRPGRDGSGSIRATTTDLHLAWSRWQFQDGCEPMGLRAFGLALDARGYPNGLPSQGKRYRSGIGLKAEMAAS